jgi:hypothetical protein
MVPTAPGSYPHAQFPVVFADGVWSVSRGPIVKFYFYRFDPSIEGTGGVQPMANAQVVMPAIGFAAMVTFFDIQLKALIDEKIVTQEQVNDMRSLIEQAQREAEGRKNAPGA